MSAHYSQSAVLHVWIVTMWYNKMIASPSLDMSTASTPDRIITELSRPAFRAHLTTGDGGLVVQSNPGSEPWRPTYDLWILDWQLRSGPIGLAETRGNGYVVSDTLLEREMCKTVAATRKIRNNLRSTEKTDVKVWPNVSKTWDGLSLLAVIDVVVINQLTVIWLRSINRCNVADSWQQFDSSVDDKVLQHVSVSYQL